MVNYTIIDDSILILSLNQQLNQTWNLRSIMINHVVIIFFTNLECFRIIYVTSNSKSDKNFIVFLTFFKGHNSRTVEGITI
jgi:hypothetical protein